MPRVPHRRSRRLAATLLALALGQLAAADLPTPPVDVPIKIDGQSSRFAREGDGFVVTYPAGFVARWGEQVLIGDALRADLRQQILYAEGRVVLVLPGVRVHAERLGLRVRERVGEAWGVTAWLEGDGRRVPLRAERLRIDRERLVFEGVHAGPAHGGLVAVGARRITVALRPRPDEARPAPARYLEGVTVVSPWASVLGLPVLWLPWAHRDFTLDYPWTRYRFGHGSRLGSWGRAQIGTGLPEVLGLRTHLEGRVDRYERVGTGLGVTGRWRHDRLGRGEALWFGIEPEQVYDPTDSEVTLGWRNAHVADVEHRVRLPGGAAYGRWTELPNADPPLPDGTPSPVDERFRADFLRDDLEHRPFARQGGAVAWGGALGTLVADTDRKRHPDVRESDRLYGLQAEVPALQLLGPVHASGDGWVERLRRGDLDVEATRLSGHGALSALEWFGGVGADATVGARGLLYGQREQGGAAVDGDEWQAVPYADSGLRIRLHGAFGRLVHIVTPRVGVQVFGRAYHDPLTTPLFGDARDRLESDRRYLTTGFDTSLTGPRELFRAVAVARWALRDRDRATVVDGVGSTGDSALADVAATATGRPWRTVTLDGSLVYDARADDWIRFDAGARWQALRRLTLSHTVAYQPVLDAWEQRPGAAVAAGRYDLEAGVSLRPGGDAVDAWRTMLARQMVDGRLGVSFELIRGVDGEVDDQRYGLEFSSR